MAAKSLVRAIVLVSVLFLGVAAPSCVELEAPADEDAWWAPEAQEGEVEEAETEVPEGALPDGSHHETEILFLGRSVMAGWFDHWGWTGDGTVTRDGRLHYYGELEVPPTIGADGAAYVDAVPDGTVVFFKLCFADFRASSAADVDGNVAEATGYAEEVVTAAEGRDIVLILGNALPSVEGDTSRYLVDTHLAYNASLEDLAATHENVYVFDQYYLLVSDDGALAKGLAVSPEDSHLNGVAYDELDAALSDFLGSVL